MPDGPVFESASASSQAMNSSVASLRPAMASRQLGTRAYLPTGASISSSASRCCADVADAGDPQIARIAGQVALRLLHQRRDDAQLRQPGAAAPAALSGKSYCQNSISAWCVGPSWPGTSLRYSPDRVVKRRVARPGLQHAVVEIVAVHLGAHEMPVDLLRNRPVRNIERRSRSRSAA